MSKQRIVVLGGGFAGVYTAIHLEHLLRRRDDVEVTLVSRENYLVFQPMLAEVISGNIGILDTVTPIRRLLRHTKLYIRQVQSVDLAGQTVTTTPGYGVRPTVLSYDHLVVALGNVTDFRKTPGLHDHAFGFKNLGDALRLRDHLIHVLAEAAVETDSQLRQQLLTFVVAGGGFSGVEVCAEINDFVRKTAHKYFALEPSEVRVVLVHSRGRILEREMPEHLGLYAQDVMQKRGVEFLFNRRLQTGTPEFAVLADGERIPTRTLVSTVPASANPIVADLDVPKDRGRILADLRTQIEGSENLWTLGDCALIPHPSGEGFCPPTAQFALRQAAVCAHNILATIDNQPQKQFAFKELGKMASLGHRRAIARLFDRFNLEGFFAWVFWRGAYLSKLPGLDRKIKVGVSWLLDLVCGVELVQTRLDEHKDMTEEHYEPGEVVVHEGDPADRLFIIQAGQAEVYRREDGDDDVLERLVTGQSFGGAAVLGNDPYPASLRCVEPLTVVTYKRRELAPLWTLPEVRQGFERLGQGSESDDHA